MWKITTDLFTLIGIIAFADRHVSASCPLELNPPSLVVRYGDTVSVNCSTPSADHHGMGWEAQIGSTEREENVKVVTWTVDTLKIKNWNVQPECYINPPDEDQCVKKLPVTLYKDPDHVSLSPTGAMMEGKKYELQCDIISVAPVRSLTVVWFKGHKIYNQSYDSLTSVTPVNVSSTLTIIPARDDDGELVFCQTHMDLGPSGPKPHLNVSSEPYILTVHYPPTFLSPKTETMDQADDVALNCTATGNPTPTYRWQCSNADQEKMGDRSVITTRLMPGICNCTASNYLGNAGTKQFIIKVNHSRTTFWAMVGPPVAIAVLALLGYVYKTQKCNNSVI